MFGSKKRQQIEDKNRKLGWEITDLKRRLESTQGELETVKTSRGKWREKAHNYRRQRTHLARELQTQKGIGQ